MRLTSLFVLLSCACSGAQVIMSGSGSKQGVHFRYETRVEPELPGQKVSGLGRGGLVVGTGFHRFLSDDTTKKYFGYDLAIEPQPGGIFRVAFQPLSLGAEKLGLAPEGGWSQLPLPRLPSPQMVRSRDTIAVDLFTHPSTGQKIVDYLFIQDDRRERLPSGPPRDYTVEDVPITLSKLRMSMNGSLVDESGGGISGEAVYFYLPNRGRFVFSLAPNEKLGFSKAGEVRGSTLTITWGNDTFVLACDGPIAPGGGVFNLYVYHDSSWRPRSGADTFHFGASSARSLVHRKL
ncbi:MAG: hypothetical protein WD696_20285 [Bryobacteraceae bacterium]